MISAGLAQTGSLEPADRAALLEYLPAEHSLHGLAWRFVPRQEQPRVLAIDAVLANIGRIPERVADPGVSLAKLAWWQQELQRLVDQDAQHPLTRALLGTGAAGRLQPGLLDAYIAGVADQVDAPSPATCAELKQRLERSAGAAALLRCAYDEQTEAAEALRAAGSAVALLDRLEAGVLEPLPGWLPMELVARFGLDRRAPVPADAERALNRALATEGLAWLSAWYHLAPAGGGRLLNGPSGRFQVLRMDITHARLQRLAQRPERFPPGRPASLFEVFGAWAAARRLYGRSSGNG